VSTGRDNLVVRAFESLHSADGIAFRLNSEIPLARGLGSSAAALGSMLRTLQATM
jgi:homoserine kinase